MGKKSLVLLLAVLLTLTASIAAAGEKEEAQEEMKRLEKVMAFSKSTLIPMINCFAQNQPRLQYLNEQNPNAGRDAITKLDYCSSAYPDSVEDSEAMALKQRVSVLYSKDIQDGRKLVDIADEYYAIRAALQAAKKKDPEKIKQRDALKQKLETQKQGLYKDALEFQKIQKDFKTWSTGVTNAFVEARKKATGK